MQRDLSGLLKKFGYTSLRKGQSEAIEHVLSKRDLLLIAPTGGGKSLIYQLPALALKGVTVVVSPLIALMKNQVDFLVSRGISAALLGSAVAEPEKRRVYADLAKPDPVTKLLYVSPELAVGDAFLGILQKLHSNARLALFAVDEAHCISSWGPTFRRSFLKLGVLKSRFPTVGMVALTATATPQVRDDIIKALRMKNAVVLIQDFDRPNIYYALRWKENILSQAQAMKESAKLASASQADLFGSTAQQSLVEVEGEGEEWEYDRSGKPPQREEDEQSGKEESDEEEDESKGALDTKMHRAVVEDICAYLRKVAEVTLASNRNNNENKGSSSEQRKVAWRGSAVVYASTRKTVEKVARAFNDLGVISVPYHAGLSGKQRETNQRRWMRGEVAVVVSTVAFGMGIDKGDVRVVVHYNVPKSLEAYYQESGRAGRDGHPAVALLYYSKDERQRQEYLNSRARSHLEQQVSQMAFHKMVGYTEGNSCLRAALLQHFGQKLLRNGPARRCCSHCTDPEQAHRDFTAAQAGAGGSMGSSFGRKPARVPGLSTRLGQVSQGRNSSRRKRDREGGEEGEEEDRTGGYRLSEEPRWTSTNFREEQHRSLSVATSGSSSAKQRLLDRLERLESAEYGEPEQAQKKMPASSTLVTNQQRELCRGKLQQALSANRSALGKSCSGVEELVLSTEQSFFKSSPSNATYYLQAVREFMGKCREATSKKVLFPVESSSPQPESSSALDLQQRLVVAKDLLNSSSTSDDVHLSVLTQLASEPVTVEVLRQTKIGVAVNTLRKTSKGPAVLQLTTDLIGLWKRLLE